LHTGDTASIDRGFVFITGRLKEIIITAGGENIPPVLIETEMKKAMPALGHCMVIGDNRKFLTVLLCLIVEVDANDGNASNKLDGVALETSKKIGSVATTTDEVLACPKWRAYFDEGLSKANENATSRAQRIAKWALHPSTFTEKGGELTPTLKLKRHEAIKLHSTMIDKLYS
jgi:long-chain-fatty-acid--CoA ligase ACSBG